MKTLAILILAHKNAAQVKRLVSRLKHEDVDIYVHCDKKWNDGYSELKYIECDNVFVLNERLSTNIDIWTLAEAPIFMTSKMTERYKYYALISGQDYPIVPIKKILSELKESYPKPFIDCTPYEFTMDDIELLKEKSKTHFFARKFDSTVDESIFNYIDEEIIGG